MRLSDRGEIDYGKRADLTIVHKLTRAIEATISNGHITHLSGEAAHRFMSGGQTALPLAAE